MLTPSSRNPCSVLGDPTVNLATPPHLVVSLILLTLVLSLENFLPLYMGLDAQELTGFLDTLDASMDEEEVLS